MGFKSPRNNRPAVETFAGAVTFNGAVTMNGEFAHAAAAYGADGAITQRSGVVVITKGTAAALTLADPSTADNFKRLVIISATAAAHTVSNAAGSGLNAGGAASDVATYGSAIGNAMELVAYGGKWLVVSLRNVTLA